VKKSKLTQKLREKSLARLVYARISAQDIAASYPHIGD
jgi:hypothetical protein